jgi:hypothetical protein
LRGVQGVQGIQGIGVQGVQGPLPLIDVAGGTYDPLLFKESTSRCDPTQNALILNSTQCTFRYMRIDNIVSVYGEVYIVPPPPPTPTPTPSNNLMTFSISLPVGSIVNQCDLSGVGVVDCATDSQLGGILGHNAARIYGNPVNNRAMVEFRPSKIDFRMTIQFNYIATI